MIKKLVLLVLCSALCLTACSSSNNSSGSEEGEALYVYDNIGEINSFAVNENSDVFTCCWQTESNSNVINGYNVNGENIYSWINENAASSINALAVKSDKIFFSSQNNDGTLCIFLLDKSTDKCEVFTELKGFNAVKRLCVANDVLFTLACGDTPENSALPFSYDNAKLLAFDLNSGEMLREFDDVALALSDTPNGNVMLYSYDTEKGYIVTEIDNAFNAVSVFENQPEGICSFAYDGSGIVLYAPSASRLGGSLTICYSPLNENSIAEIMPNVIAVNDGNIIYKGGYTFILNSMDGRLIKLKNSSYIKANRQIKIISSQVYLTSAFSAGYSTSFEEKTNDELSLAVLSNDSDFDIFYISSQQNIAKNLKDNGIYYPLDDVPYVKEFIDACFPYIKEAVMDENGSITMIPIDVSVPVIAYNNENCLSDGADFSNVNDISGLTGALTKLTQQKADNFYFNVFPLLQSNLRAYFKEYKNFDTENFRAMASEIKKLYKLPNGNPNADYNYILGKNNDFLFSTIDQRTFQTSDYLINSDDLNVRGVSTEENGLNSAICTYLCVNPSSGNLEATLGYVSALCEYMLSLDNLCMFENQDKYSNSEYAKQLYEIYKNSRIDFTVSDDIYADDFEKYLNSEISIDGFITEADRKLNAYLNE